MRFSSYFEENFLSLEKINILSVKCSEAKRSIFVDLLGEELLSIPSFKKLIKGLEKLSHDLRKYEFDFKISYKELKLDNTKLYNDYFFVILTELNVDYELLTLSNCSFTYSDGSYNLIVSDEKKISDEIIQKAIALFMKYGLKIKINLQLLNKENINEIKQEQAALEYSQMIENINTNHIAFLKTK